MSFRAKCKSYKSIITTSHFQTASCTVKSCWLNPNQQHWVMSLCLLSRGWIIKLWPDNRPPASTNLHFHVWLSVNMHFHCSLCIYLMSICLSSSLSSKASSSPLYTSSSSFVPCWERVTCTVVSCCRRQRRFTIKQTVFKVVMIDLSVRNLNSHMCIKKSLKA